MNWIGCVGIIYLALVLLSMLRGVKNRVTQEAVFLGWIFIGAAGFVLGWLGAQ